MPSMTLTDTFCFILFSTNPKAIATEKQSILIASATGIHEIRSYTKLLILPNLLVQCMQNRDRLEVYLYTISVAALVKRSMIAKPTPSIEKDCETTTSN